MRDRTLATKYRPQKYQDVVGQEAEVEILKKIATGVWKPPVLMFAGPWGTGKTTLARLTAKALLCEQRQEAEPCGECRSCKAVEGDSHPGYTELDASSNGAVSNVREIKDLLEYKPSGGLQIITFDESHMLTAHAQNAMLKLLEEGLHGVMLAFCTTETEKMLSTIRSRCIEFDLKLLTATQIKDRLRNIVDTEKRIADDKALRIVSTYVRGHMRDAIMLLEQLLGMGDEVTEELARTYLRLDRYVEVYEFLSLKDKKQQFNKLEELLCSFSAMELQEIVGQSLLNAYKLRLGVGEFAQVDEAWLNRIGTVQGDTLLKKADAVLGVDVDFATINHATAMFAKIFVDETVIEMAMGQESHGSLMPSFRKPKPAVV